MVVSIVLYGFLAIVVAGALFVLATRFLPAGEQIAPPLRDEPVWALPAERSLRPEEVDTVRLPVALRGYRFAETDVLLDRLVHELRRRDDEIARLRSADGHPAPWRQPVDDGAYARPEPPADEPVRLQKDDALEPLSFAPTQRPDEPGAGDHDVPPPYADGDERNRDRPGT
ncbi:DivIVA domain-containing protein [Jatrophihabitans fulvus]